MRTLTLRLLLVTLVTAGAAHAQDRAPSVHSHAGVIERHFDRAVETTASHVETSGWGNLTSPEGRQEYRLLVEQIDQSLDDFRTKPRLEGAPTTLAQRLTRFFVYMDSIYGYPERDLAPAVLEAKDEITLVVVQHLAALNAEYYRRFFVKYGAGSERLNLVEGWLLNRRFSTVPVDALERQISPWEPILRVQVVGYEWDVAASDLRPSPLLFQAGASYYLFGDRWVARTLNHLGGAVAYQPEATGGSGLWGVVGHVRNLDVGVLCPSWRCRSAIWLASVNVQLIRNVF